MELELKHLASYLPHGVLCATPHGDKKLTGLMAVGSGGFGVSFNQDEPPMYNPFLRYEQPPTSLPYLRPLAQLTQEITHNGGTFVPLDILDGKGSGFVGGDTLRSNPNALWAVAWASIEKLFEWHFDVYGLLENDLAIEKPAK